MQGIRAAGGSTRHANLRKDNDLIVPDPISPKDPDEAWYFHLGELSLTHDQIKSEQLGVRGSMQLDGDQRQAVADMGSASAFGSAVQMGNVGEKGMEAMRSALAAASSTAAPKPAAKKKVKNGNDPENKKGGKPATTPGMTCILKTTSTMS